MFKPWYKQLINVDSSLSTCAKTGLSLYSIIVLFAFSAIASFPHWASERWYQYGSVLLPHSTLLAMSLCLASYEQCSTRLLKVLHKCCNTDVLGFYWYSHSPSGAVCPRDHAYISVKPLVAVLQPISTWLYVPWAIVYSSVPRKFYSCAQHYWLT